MKKRRWCVYILECSDGTLYTGATNDLRKRFSKHNKGQAAKYTRGRRPVKLKYVRAFMSKACALIEERRIKKLKRKDKKKLLCVVDLSPIFNGY